MPDNRPTPADAPFDLPGHRVLALEGPDAVTFAQAQFMNDVAALPDGRWQWNGWLTPKGRVVALFALLRLDASRLLLVLPDVDPEALAAQLQRFVFRSKVRLSTDAGWRIAGRFDAPDATSGAAGAAIGREGDGTLVLDMGGDGGPRTLRLVPPGAGDAQPPAVDEAALARWRRADLEHGLPRLDPSQAGEWTPQMLSLERLQAFSVRKGCYPGQEIVARTHFLGQAKRRLALLDAETPIETGTEVTAGGQAIGRVASVAGDCALAVLPVDIPGGECLAGAVPVRLRALRSGLAR